MESLIQPVRNRNKIEIQKICPSIPKNEVIINCENSILGISINSPPASGSKISAIFDFLTKRGLTKINLLMGDSLYRYTAMIKYQCSEKDGKNIGMEESQQLIEYYKGLVSSDGAPCRLNFFHASEVEKEDQFHIIYENIWKLFETYPEFRLSVLNFSNYYFNRAFESSHNTEKDCTQLAYKYLIEELAILAILNQRGFNTLLYPGVIQTIYDVITMKHQYLSDLFKDYIFVSLRIKRKS